MTASKKYPTLIDFRVFFIPVSQLKMFWSKSYILALFNRWGGWPTWPGIRRQFHYNSGSHRSRHHVCNQLVLGDTTKDKPSITRLSRSGVRKSLFPQTTVAKKRKKKQCCLFVLKEDAIRSLYPGLFLVESPLYERDPQSVCQRCRVSLLTMLCMSSVETRDPAPSRARSVIGERNNRSYNINWVLLTEMTIETTGLRDREK